MMTSQTQIQRTLTKLTGLKPWGVKLGFGTFVTIEFGKPQASVQHRGAEHGEWHLWLYMCAWRFQTADRIIVGSEDERSRIESSLESLSLQRLRSVRLLRPALDLAIKFGAEHQLLTFSPSSVENEMQWILYTPEGNSVAAFGDGTHKYGKSSEPLPAVRTQRR